MAEVASDPLAPDMLGIVEMKAHAETFGHTPRAHRYVHSGSEEEDGEGGGGNHSGDDYAL